MSEGFEPYNLEKIDLSYVDVRKPTIVIYLIDELSPSDVQLEKIVYI